jgi:voltage-gated potassium channel
MTLAEWRRTMAIPTLILSLLYTFVFVFPIYWYPVDHHVKTLCEWTEYGIWALFVIDYFIEMKLAPDNKKFFFSNLFLLFLVLIPFFRPLRVIRALLFTTQAGIRSRKRIIKSIPIVIAAASVLMVITMGAAMLDVERAVPGSNIRTPSDGLWWALVSITTVGYGDKFPVTNEGRLLGGILIIAGIAMMSILTGAFAAWILEHRAID